MIVFNNLDKACLHIPKCGGTTIREYFGFLHSDNECTTFRNCSSYMIDGIRDHGYAEEYELMGFDVPDYTFVIVRNPYDRVISGYDHYLRRNTEKKLVSFKEWFRRQDLYGYPEHKRSFEKGMKPYYENANSIYKLEDGLDHAFSSEGIKTKMNKTKKNSSEYGIVLFPFEKELIYNRFKHEFEDLGYKK